MQPRIHLQINQLSALHLLLQPRLHPRQRHFMRLDLLVTITLPFAGSITLAGKHLYVSSDNGSTIVLEPGREYKELARNSLETFRSSLVFEGKRMYVRTTKGLWCIGLRRV